jgi:hypothetical protein
MAQLDKAQTILKFLARKPGTVRVSAGNSKAAVILSGCATLGAATAVFRFRGSRVNLLALAAILF